MRSLKEKPFMVLEQQPLQVNWHDVNERLDYSWLFLWTLQSAFLGARGMHYFSWQRFPGGAEQYHDAIISHDVRIPETWQERTLRAINAAFSECAKRFKTVSNTHSCLRRRLRIRFRERLVAPDHFAVEDLFDKTRARFHICSLCRQWAWAVDEQLNRLRSRAGFASTHVWCCLAMHLNLRKRSIAKFRRSSLTVAY